LAISGTSSEWTTLLFSSNTTTARAVKPLSGLSAMSTPYLPWKPWLRKVESVTTLFRPSALQKRDMANGRSADITSTTVLVMLLAFSLNTRVDLAQVGVSRLG